MCPGSMCSGLVRTYQILVLTCGNVGGLNDVGVDNTEAALDETTEEVLEKADDLD